MLLKCLCAFNFNVCLIISNNRQNWVHFELELTFHLLYCSYFNPFIIWSSICKSSTISTCIFCKLGYKLGRHLHEYLSNSLTHRTIFMLLTFYNVNVDKSFEVWTTLFVHICSNKRIINFGSIRMWFHRNVISASLLVYIVVNYWLKWIEGGSKVCWNFIKALSKFDLIRWLDKINWVCKGC